MMHREPLQLPAYRLSYAYWNEVQKELDNMLKSEIIELSKSE